MKSHKYWSIGALITMLGTFYTGYKGSKEGHKYFAASSLLWYGCRWTDVHCFSIIDYWWHYSIGDVTFIIDQEEKTNGI